MEQVGKGTGCAQLAELRPQAALEDSGVEVEDPLALNERIGAHGVIAGRKLRDLDLGSKFCERVGDAALTFVHIDDDLHPCRLRPSHRRILDHSHTEACSGLA